MNKTYYYIDACEILRFPSEIKAGISPSLFQPPVSCPIPLSHLQHVSLLILLGG
jgi:hypothetical protein